MARKLLIFVLLAIWAEYHESVHFPTESRRNVRNTNVDQYKQWNNFLDGVISNGISKFTIDMHRELSLGQKRQNSDEFLVFSPICVAEALALVLLGSGGSTFQEISKALGLADTIDMKRYSNLVLTEFGRLLDELKSDHIKSAQSISASALFVQESFPVKEEFQRNAINIFHSEVRNLNYETNANDAQRAVNAWVANKTNGKIQDILQSPPPVDTKVIITSVLYFKGEWQEPFEIEGRRPFYPYGRKNKSSVMVDMMYNAGTFMHYYDKELDCQIVGLPYKGNTTSMYLILPNDSSKDKLRTLERNLNDAHLNRLLNSMTMHETIVVIPKMTLTSTNSLRDTLINLGVRSLFDPAEADLSLISGGESDKVDAKVQAVPPQLPARQASQPIYVPTTEKPFIFSRLGETNPGLYADEVLHKVYIDINESGTEAAASTSITTTRDGHRARIRLDEPFLFLIRRTDVNLNLFWGSVSVPSPFYKS